MTPKTRIKTTRKTGRTRKNGKSKVQSPSGAEPRSKHDIICALLARHDGASIAELVGATGWQAHSIRGALAGSLKKKGVLVHSTTVDGLRRYHTGATR